MRDILLYFSCAKEGNWFEIYKSIKDKEKVEEKKIVEMKKKITSNYITILDEDYPEILKNVLYPPYVLFYKGDLSILKEENIIAVIGARECSSYGKEMTEKLVIELVNKGYIIMSGLAKGIDSIAHKTCLENQGKTVAVVGSGLNYTYPKENYELQKKIEESGLLISEYPDFVKPKAIHYPYRNRIIAILAKSILVTEAKYKSGTMITVRHGLEYGKDIYVVPYLATAFSGCNKLIKQGAQLVESIEDII